MDFSHFFLDLLPIIKVSESSRSFSSRINSRIVIIRIIRVRIIFPPLRRLLFWFRLLPFRRWTFSSRPIVIAIPSGVNMRV